MLGPLFALVVLQLVQLIFTQSTSLFPRKKRAIKLFLDPKQLMGKTREANFSWIFGQMPCFYRKCSSYDLRK